MKGNFTSGIIDDIPFAYREEIKRQNKENKMDSLKFIEEVKELDKEQLLDFFSNSCGLYSVECYLNRPKEAQEANFKSYILKEEILNRLKQ